MINKKKRDYLFNELALDCALFENPSYDNSIIGVTSTGKVVYDFDLMVEELSVDEKLTETDALDFVDYNTMRTLPYIDADIRPIVIHRVVI